MTLSLFEGFSDNIAQPAHAQIEFTVPYRVTADHLAAGAPAALFRPDAEEARGRLPR
jgi:hypothetical protein